jgi:hypothetical protein
MTPGGGGAASTPAEATDEAAGGATTVVAFGVPSALLHAPSASTPDITRRLIFPAIVGHVLRL